MQAVDWASPWSFSYSHQRKALYMRMTQTPGSHGYPHWISKNVSSEGDRGENTLVAIFWKRVGRWMSEETLVAEGRNTRSRLSSTSTVTITNTLSVIFGGCPYLDKYCVCHAREVVCQFKSRHPLPWLSHPLLPP